MIDARQLIDRLKSSGVSLFVGVPDSLLAPLCATLLELPPAEHLIATNEGSAVGIAIGHYLATGRPAVVYMQNSGLGNAVNPLVSLAHAQIYGIPMILVIGWRAEVGEDGAQLRDEPQHQVQGRITLGQLGLMDIPHRLLDAESCEAPVLESVHEALQRSGPVALLVRAKTFPPALARAQTAEGPRLTREAAIAAIAESVPSGSPVVATTGMASRELHELRKQRGAARYQDFLTVGGMGHASQVALGLARNLPNCKVYCIDGDGAALMHLGALGLCARQQNLVHIIVNNGAHDSVGGQPTLGTDLSFARLAGPLGYMHCLQAPDAPTLQQALAQAATCLGSVLIEILCKTGVRPDLGRPTQSPAENKKAFMSFLNGCQA